MNKESVTTFKPKYSGKSSVKFWDRIKTIKNEKRRHIAYGLGCIIQLLESELEVLLGKEKL